MSHLSSKMPEALSETLPSDGIKGQALLQQYGDPTQPAQYLQEAANALTFALEKDPDDLALYSQLAETFFLLRQDKKAEQFARKILSYPEGNAKSYDRNHLNPLKAAAYETLGLLYQAQGDEDKAIHAFKQALRFNALPGARSRAQLALLFAERVWKEPIREWSLIGSIFYYGLTALLTFPWLKGRLSFGLILCLIPQLLFAWTLEESGKRDLALNAYLTLAEHYPGLPSLGLTIGELYREKGNYDAARLWFERVLARHPGHIKAHYHLARLFEEQEDYPAMATVYKRLSDMRPLNADLQCHLGNAYYCQSQFKEAKQYYMAALSLGGDPKWKALIAQSLGNIEADYYQNTEAAIAYYDMALTLNPGHLENYLQLGLMYFQQEAYQNAELVYRRATQQAPHNAKLFCNLGYLRWLAQDIDDAIVFYQKAIALDPDYEIPINNLGVIYLDMQGQVELAIQQFQQALEINPDYALAYYNLGRAYSFLGNRAEAAHCFDVARNLNQDSHELDNEELSARIRYLFDSCEVELKD